MANDQNNPFISWYWRQAAEACLACGAHEVIFVMGIDENGIIQPLQDYADCLRCRNVENNDELFPKGADRGEHWHLKSRQGDRRDAEPCWSPDAEQCRRLSS